MQRVPQITDARRSLRPHKLFCLPFQRRRASRSLWPSMRKVPWHSLIPRRSLPALTRSERRANRSEYIGPYPVVSMTNYCRGDFRKSITRSSSNFGKRHAGFDEFLSMKNQARHSKPRRSIARRKDACEICYLVDLDKCRNGDCGSNGARAADVVTFRSFCNWLSIDRRTCRSGLRNVPYRRQVCGNAAQLQVLPQWLASVRQATQPPADNRCLRIVP